MLVLTFFIFAQITDVSVDGVVEEGGNENAKSEKYHWNHLYDKALIRIVHNRDDVRYIWSEKQKFTENTNVNDEPDNVD